MSVPCAVVIIVFLSTVNGGILKDIINYTRGKETVSTTAAAIIARNPLHYDEQSYLEDNTEDEIKVKKVANRQVGPSSAVTRYDLKEGQNGVYEFNIGSSPCKFYVGSRQQQRSIYCNEKRCQEKDAGWSCEVPKKKFYCTVEKENKQAACRDNGAGVKWLADAPRRCTGGQMQDGVCRENFE